MDGATQGERGARVCQSAQWAQRAHIAQDHGAAHGECAEQKHVPDDEEAVCARCPLGRSCGSQGREGRLRRARCMVKDAREGSASGPCCAACTRGTLLCPRGSATALTLAHGPAQLGCLPSRGQWRACMWGGGVACIAWSGGAGRRSGQRTRKGGDDEAQAPDEHHHPVVPAGGDVGVARAGCVHRQQRRLFQPGCAPARELPAAQQPRARASRSARMSSGCGRAGASDAPDNLHVVSHQATHVYSSHHGGGGATVPSTPQARATTVPHGGGRLEDPPGLVRVSKS